MRSIVDLFWDVFKERGIKAACEAAYYRMRLDEAQYSRSQAVADMIALVTNLLQLDDKSKK